MIEDAVFAIAAEYEGRVDCPSCGGDGEVIFEAGPDASREQPKEVVGKCPLCAGSGVVDGIMALAWDHYELKQKVSE